MSILKNVHLALAFLLELAMLAALAYWSYLQGKSPLIRWVLALAVPMLAAVLWGIFAAPRSQHRLDFYPRMVFEVLLFSLTALLLYKAGQSSLSLCFAVLSLLSITLAFVFKQ